MDPIAITDRGPRDVIDVRGDDALSYLQGQLSQDVQALVPGRPSWSLLLEPTGKMGWWIRVVRFDEPARLQIDVDAGAGEAVRARLERFKLRSAVTFELQPGASRDPSGADADLGDYEAVRIEAGLPRAGAEITEGVIPAELGQWLIDQSVSFTKGCYTGQELVARIDSRGGNVPRHLRGLVLEGDEMPEPGAAVCVGDDVVGTVTSAARSSDLAAPIALAFIARRVEVPAAATVAVAGAARPAEIRLLPLVGTDPA
jgi:tRNA-modifying protein YgfZ